MQKFLSCHLFGLLLVLCFRLLFFCANSRGVSSLWCDLPFFLHFVKTHTHNNIGVNRTLLWVSFMCPGCGNGRGNKTSGQLAVIILPHFLPHTSNSLSNTHTHMHNTHAHKHSHTSPFPTGPARVLTQPCSFAKISTKKQAFL